MTVSPLGPSTKEGFAMRVTSPGGGGFGDYTFKYTAPGHVR
jgi:hypothetical protein